jgi:predicted nucleic acid-binding protein
VANAFLDTNIILRHLLADHDTQSPRATQFLRRVESGDVRVVSSHIVFFEAVFTLQRTYRQPKAAISEALLALIDLPGIRMNGKPLLREAMRIFVDANVSFADAYHAALMNDQGVSEVISFDKDFDRIAGIRRTEP